MGMSTLADGVEAPSSRASLAVSTSTPALTIAATEFLGRAVAIFAEDVEEVRESVTERTRSDKSMVEQTEIDAGNFF